jgi:phosphoribosylformylglycinamidine synthase subunit PurS
MASSIGIQVLVRLKAGVLDVQGKTIQSSLQGAFPDHVIDHVRVGKLIEMEVEASSQEEAIEKARILCEQILVNPVIESFEIKPLL